MNPGEKLILEGPFLQIFEKVVVFLRGNPGKKKLSLMGLLKEGVINKDDYDFIVENKIRYNPPASTGSHNNYLTIFDRENKDGTGKPRYRPRVKLADKIAGQPEFDHEIKALGAYPYPCPNCGKPVQNKRLFCCNLCRDEAKFVRYFRGCIVDGRHKQDDVKEALRIRLAHILGGGYREHLRRIPDEIRKAVSERDNHVCQCGSEGTQIHHINGDSGDIKNLQTICTLCHLKETRKKIIGFTKESHPELREKRIKLLERVFSPQPLRFCDDFRWNKLWAAVKRERYKNYRKQGTTNMGS